jgi:hypothetical protein
MSDVEETLICQKLMTADEVYVYKIPALKDSGGHRYVWKDPHTLFNIM